MSRYIAQSKSQKPIVSVRVHNSPILPTPRIMPTSPDMIPAFDFTNNDGANDPDTLVTKEPKPLQKRKNPAYTVSGVIVTNSSRNLKIHKFSKTQKPNLDRRSLNIPQMKIPLQLNKLKSPAVKRSRTLTNIEKDETNVHIPLRRAYSSRNYNESAGDDNVLKTFFNSEFPPYNPTDFAPEERDVNSQNTKKEVNKTNYNQELVKKIRQELDEWMAGSLSSEKKTCPEQWSSPLPAKCKEEAISVAAPLKHPISS